MSGISWKCFKLNRHKTETFVVGLKSQNVFRFIIAGQDPLIYQFANKRLVINTLFKLVNDIHLLTKDIDFFKQSLSTLMEYSN